MIEKIIASLRSMEQYIDQQEQIAPSVSKVSIGWHVEHSAMTIRAIATALKSSNPSAYKYTFNWNKVLIFALNKLPRRKAKAPKIVVPTEPLTPSSLSHSLDKAIELLQDLKPLSAHHYFKHPYLDDLKKKDALKIMYLHTKHHLVIIEEIAQCSQT